MISRRHVIAGAAAAPLAGCLGYGDWRPAPSDPPQVDRLFDDRFAEAAAAARLELRRARERLGAPSMTAAVAAEGRLVWAGAVGWADLEARVPATIDTIYRIGSTSKAVTATVLARLVDEGRIGLDQPVGQVAAAPLPNPAWADLTPRRLASHTAGLPGYEENRDLWGLAQTVLKRRRFASTREALEVFDDTPLLYAPGERYLYSSFDVNLLAYALEGAGAASYLDLVGSRVRAPLGLATPLADAPADRTRAVSYEKRGDGRLRRWRPVDLSDKHPSGGLAATSADLARLGAAWLDPRFVKPATREAFWTEQALNDGRPNGDNYAIGWRVNRSPLLLGPDRPVTSVNHAGVSQGAWSWLNVYPEQGLAVALNTNMRGGEVRDFLRMEPALSRPFVSRP